MKENAATVRPGYNDVQLHPTTSLPREHPYIRGAHTYKTTLVGLRKDIDTKRMSLCGISL